MAQIPWVKWKFTISQDGMANTVSSLGGFASQGPRSQFLPLWCLGKLGLLKCLVKWRLQFGVATCFGNSSMHLDSLRFPLLICLCFAAWEKLGQDAENWTGMLTCTLTKTPKTQPTKPLSMEVLIEDLTEQIVQGVSLSLVLLNINLLSVAALKPLPSFVKTC